MVVPEPNIIWLVQPNLFLGAPLTLAAALSINGNQQRTRSHREFQRPLRRVSLPSATLFCGNQFRCESSSEVSATGHHENSDTKDVPRPGLRPTPFRGSIALTNNLGV